MPAPTLMDPDLYWALPGPRRFVNGIVDRIKTRSSVIVEVPKCNYPPDLLGAVTDRLGPASRWRDIQAEQLPPGELLSDHETLFSVLSAVGVPPPSDPHRALGPLVEDTLGNWTVWVDARGCDDVHVIDSVLRLVSSIGGALKNWSQARPAFVVELEASQREMASPCVGLDVVPWRGVLDRLDSSSYIHHRAQLLRPSIAPAQEAAVVEIAGFDLSLAEQLLVDWDGSISSLEPLFDDVRVRNQWQIESACDDLRARGVSVSSQASEQWALGYLDIWPKNRIFPHSALLPIEGVLSVTQRIIAAQMRCVFPEVEAERTLLAHWAERENLFPHGDGIDLADVEIADLAKAVHRRGGMRFPDRASHAHRLADLRNDVAHRTVLSLDQCKGLDP